MITKILIGLAGVIILIILAALFKSPDFRVERSLYIAATPDVLFGWVNNPKKFNEWNPFMKLDPAVQTSFSGSEAGVGAVSSWEGKKVGKGQSTIIESKPGELVRMRMDWLAPIAGTNTVDFTFQREGDKTNVTWAMYGKNTGLLPKLLSLFMNCETMCGPQFEKGLANLAQIATTPPAR